MTIAEAKQRLTIPEIWTRLELPGTPAKSCRAPWREDRTASFSVSQDGKLWNDFATGEGGDAVAFLQKAKGLDTKEACREYLRLAGNRGESPIKLVTQNHPSKRPVYRPQLRRGTTEEIEALSRLRCISPQGLDAAQQAGILALSNLKGHTAWIITDSTARNFQARRLDGKTWTHIGEKKAWTLPGSQAAWPIGILNAASFKNILLCEGGPDLLAAFHFITTVNRRDLFPVAMLGAGLRIHCEALEHFSGKRVRIFPHVDENGQGLNAAAAWQNQLEDVGAIVDAFSFDGLLTKDGKAVKDLNDLAKTTPGPSRPDLWEGF